MDRMFLISSAITKAFHGDRGQYARCVKLGPEEKGGDMVVNLTPAEQRIFIGALMERRERMLEQTDGVEQLLRRMTGSITAYMDLVGERPLHMSDHDRASLAIRDCELTAFKELLPKCADTLDSLLVEAAGRSGDVGRKMTIEVVAAASRISEGAYRQATRNAVDIGDTERVKFLMEQAQHMVEGMDATYHGEIIDYACMHNRSMGRALVNYAPDEWIAAAPPDLLYHATLHPNQDCSLADELVRKGAPCGDQAWTILNQLTSGGNAWIAAMLLRDGMKVPADDYGALDACVRNGALDAAKILIEHGVDYDRYLEWASAHETGDRDAETLETLMEHWDSIRPAQEQTHGWRGPTMETSL